MKYSALVIILFAAFMQPHGFAPETMVQINNDATYMRLDQIAQMQEIQEAVYVQSFDLKNNRSKTKKVQSTGIAQSNYACHIFINDDPRPIICSSTQTFYDTTLRNWRPAHELSVGDRLLCNNKKIVTVTNIQIFQNQVTLYAIQVKKYHTFCVTKHNVITHNMFLPACAIGISIPIDIGCGGAIGSMFGPVGICGGLVIGGIVGLMVSRCSPREITKFDIFLTKGQITSFQTKATEDNKPAKPEKAPGKPTENDGFVPKKNWDGKKVRHPRGFGWPDAKGNIWIPSGVNGHGGAHWDVQHSTKDNKYTNIVPGGQERGKK